MAVISGEGGGKGGGWTRAGKVLPASSHLLAQVGGEMKRQILNDVAMEANI